MVINEGEQKLTIVNCGVGRFSHQHHVVMPAPLVEKKDDKLASQAA